MKRKYRIWVGIVVGLLIVVELFARFYLGLGNPPLYIEDPDYEYIYAPGQHVKRFGNVISTNEFSMRSKPLSKKDKVRILKIGDSIINGGAQTDDDSLASSILEKMLGSEFHDSIRVLNIGANSWGPDNAFAYINKHGRFGASMIVLVFSSHDLKDNMHHQKVVGVHGAWPDKKPFCALSDGFFKYFVPFVRKKLDKNYSEYDYFENIQNSDQVNPGWKSFFDYAKMERIELLIYLHPTKKETANRAFDQNGNELLKMFEDNNINFLSGLEAPMDDRCYRDFIHLNEKGQRKLAEKLISPMRSHVFKQLNRKK